jgi:hypothetical protein
VADFRNFCLHFYMENKTFYIRYQENQPVKIETHFIGELDRRRPLTDVADLIQGIGIIIGSLYNGTNAPTTWPA